MRTTTRHWLLPMPFCAALVGCDFEVGDKESDSGSTGTPAEGLAPTGDPPGIAWHMGQGTDGEEHVHEGIQTRDGGYIAIGQTGESGGRRGTDMLVIKVDAEGELEWRTIIGSARSFEVGIAILEVEDGYWAAGGLESDGTQQSAIVKLDADGNEVWRRTYHEDGSAALRGLDHAGDGRVIATGYRSGTEDGFVFVSEESVGVLLLLDDAGNAIWDVDLEVPQGTKVRTMDDGGYAVLSTAWTFAGGEDVQNAALVRTDADGGVLWSQTYGGADNNQAFDFDLDPSGGFVLAGHTTGFGAVNWDCLMLRIDADGELLWHERFGQPRGYDARYVHDECYGIRVDERGGYVMVGGTGDEYDHSEDGHPAGASDEWKSYAVRVEPDGTLDWAQVYGDGAGEGHNAAEFLSLTADGGYLLFNDTDSAGDAEPNNFGFMKLEAPAR